MHTTNQILNEISARHGGCTDYRLSKLLGTSPSGVGNWRAGRTALSPEFALRAAALLDWDPAYVVACMEHERAEKLEATDEIKATWEKIAERFKPAAAVILAAWLWAGGPAPSDAYAGARAVVSTDDLYIMRSMVRRLRRRLRAICDALRLHRARVAPIYPA